MVAPDFAGSLILLLGLFGFLAPDTANFEVVQSASLSVFVIGTLLTMSFLAAFVRQVLGKNKAG